jgi:hypothetical protein
MREVERAGYWGRSIQEVWKGITYIPGEWWALQQYLLEAITVPCLSPKRPLRVQGCPFLLFLR